MALTVVIGGLSYSIPEPNDSGYGTALDSFWKALVAGFLPIAGGTAALTAELDLGGSFGIKPLYLKTRTANPAAAGLVRLAKTDTINLRNNVNGADLALGIDTADALTFGGQNVTGNPMLDSTTVAGQSIANGATEVIVVFGTATTDTDAGLNTGTGRYTVPAGKGGHYIIAAQLAYATAPTGTCTISLFKNAVLLKTSPWNAPAAAQSMPLSIGPILVAAGDVLDVRTKHGNGAPQSLVTTAGQVWFSLKRVPT